MPSRKARFTHLLERVGVLELLLRARAKLSVPYLTVLNYHRIATPRASQKFNLDDRLIDATPEEFDRQLSVVKRYLKIIDLEMLREHVTGGRPLPPNPVLITFDDGYRDNRDTALPILKRHGISATFFISTACISDRLAFWWDRIAHQVTHAERSELVLTYPEPMRIELRGDRLQAVSTLQQMVIRRHGLDLDRFLRDITEATAIEWTDALNHAYADELMMTWDHVRELHAAGMHIASHTRTHRVLQTLTEDRLMDELVGSRLDIERETGRKPFAISYPVSRAISDQPGLCAAVRNAGYDLGFSASSGVMPLWGPFDPLNIRRVGLDRGTPASMFRGILAIPWLAGSSHRKRTPPPGAKAAAAQAAGGRTVSP